MIYSHITPNPSETQSPQDEEAWKPVVGFEDFYEVSNLGRVRRTETHHILRPSYDNHGYPRVHLSINGQSRVIRIHQIVAKTFLKSLQTDLVVNHIDNNPCNNQIENLEYVTRQENLRHAVKQGRMGKHKISQTAISGIISLIEQRSPHLTYREIAEISKVNIQVVSNIGRGSRVGSVMLDYHGATKKGNHGRIRKLSQEDIGKIKEFLSDEQMTQKDIADLFAIDPAVVSRIKSNTYELRLRNKRGVK